MLMYSQMFGFSNVDSTPKNAVPGTLIRHMSLPHHDPQFDDIADVQWYIRMRKKDHHGRNILEDWVKLPRGQIPAKVKMEALLLGIQL